MDRLRSKITSGPSFQDFIRGVPVNRTCAADGEHSDKHSYLPEDLEMGNSRKGECASLKAVNVTLGCVGQVLNCCFVSISQCILKPMDVR